MTREYPEPDLRDLAVHAVLLAIELHEQLRVADDDVLAAELSEEIASLKVAHQKQLKQMQTELRKALSAAASAGGHAPGGGADAAMQVMHGRKVEALQSEIRNLRVALEHAEAERSDGADPSPASPSLLTPPNAPGGKDDDAPAVAWEVAVVGSLGEVRRTLLTTCHALADEADALDPGGPLRMAARAHNDAGSRAALERLAADDAADASDELRRVQLTADALESIVERILRARSHGLARPPRWLVLSWHYMHGCAAAPPGDLRAGGPRDLGDGGMAAAYSTPRQMANRVRAALQRRRRGYDRVPMSM